MRWETILKEKKYSTKKIRTKIVQLDNMIKNSGRNSRAVYYQIKRDPVMKQIFLEKYLGNDEDMLKQYMEIMPELIQLQDRLERGKK
ncbi:MAG: hypothetical protein GOVbin4206_51 [Prokaryotic dsDNA virus sp.]|nr:MAG: hypothetical protein GOVbin4206_51 [Prokaryotic dsDNA virus sp.]|tara:strand:- start:172 stop:432 length:261 start_codon:yes stop_codon:yes gene_type:complete